MAINHSEMKVEEENLLKTEKWISKEIGLRRGKLDEINNKVSNLKKSSGGTYSEELQLALTVHQFAEKNLKKFTESKEQPYFARIDFKEKLRDTDSFYIGKFGLGDSDTGEEKVIDWRSPIADLYYSGTQGKAYYEAPVGVIEGELELKRKFLIKKGVIKDAFDEGINEIVLKSGVEEEEGNALIDEFLKINLEESRSSKLKDVVATIQKEQNDIIRADLNKPMIVQGSAGSGKTTVALHRLAYILYRHNKFLKGEDVLVIAPNKLFLDYISEILPNLGVSQVEQMTFEELCMKNLKLKGKSYSKDDKLASLLEKQNHKENNLITTVSKIKGSTFYKIIMDRYIRYIEIHDSKVEDIKYEEFTMFTAKEIRRLYLKDLAHLPLKKRKEEIKRYFKNKLKSNTTAILDNIDYEYSRKVLDIKKVMDDSPKRRERLIKLYDERDNKKENFKKQGIKAIDAYFKKWDFSHIKNIYLDFFNNNEVFKEVSAGKIPDNIYHFMKNETLSRINSKEIDSDDLCAMLYLKFKIEGLKDEMKFKHLVIDEAQDYSIFQFQVLKDITLNNSFTIVGDIGQGIYFYKGIEEWNKVINEVFNGEVDYIPLTQSYRSTVEIINFANIVLEKQENNLKPAKPVLRHGKEPEVIQYEETKEFAEMLDCIVSEVENLGKKTIAVIGRTYEQCIEIKKVLDKHSEIKWDLIKDNDKTINLEKIIIPSYMTKGLEFDCSVIYNCNNENYANRELDKKLLYVVLTRALHLEYIFYSGEMTELIKRETDNNLN